MTGTKQGHGRIRLFVSDELSAGRVVGSSPAQAHYLRNVMRLKSGDEVALFNGRDGEWRARIDGLGKGWCSLALESQSRRQTREADLWLVFAPLKRARLDFVAQHATELGVTALWPVFTRHTIVSRVNHERLLANAVEAAEQSARLSVPEVMDPAPLQQALARWPEGRRLYVCDETGNGRPVAEVFADASREPAAILCGPEGGFTASELDGLRKQTIVTTITLGPRVLRAETAAIAALSCWQALAGDWRQT